MSTLKTFLEQMGVTVTEEPNVLAHKNVPPSLPVPPPVQEKNESATIKLLKSLSDTLVAETNSKNAAATAWLNKALKSNGSRLAKAV